MRDSQAKIDSADFYFHEMEFLIPFEGFTTWYDSNELKNIEGF